MWPTVTIVLVTYYGDANLARLYGSLLAQRYPAARWRLVVVENGPARDAARWFVEHAPDVTVVIPGRNTGYAGGVALGMEHAIRYGAEHVAVVTQDTWVEPDWIGALVDAADRFPRAGAIQPKIVRDDHGRTVINTWGNELHFVGVGYPGGDGRPDGPLDARSIAYASGAGVLYRVRALRDVGLPDARLFMYHEDTDISWRMRLAGWDVVLAPAAVMHHDYEFGRGGDKFYYIERNRVVNLLTHYRLRTLAILAPALLAFDALTLVFAARNGWLRKRLGVYAFFLRPDTWRYLRGKRRRVQTLRRVSDRAIAALLTATFAFPGVDGWAVRAVVNPVFRTYWAVAHALLRW